MNFDLAAMTRRARNPRRSQVEIRPIVRTATMAANSVTYLSKSAIKGRPEKTLERQPGPDHNAIGVANMALPEIIAVPPRVKDLAGQRYSRLIVLGYVGNHQLANGRNRPRFLCQCDCGGTAVLQAQTLISGYAKSCGCYQREVASKTAKRLRAEGLFRIGGHKRHGLSHTSIHNIWSGIRERCRNANSAGFKRYGGRGIDMCDRWYDSFEAFYEDMGPRPAGMSVDRIDNDKGYSPENCRWATVSEQAQNTSKNTIVEYNGESMALAEAARRSGVKRGTIKARIERGLTGARVFEPVA